MTTPELSGTFRGMNYDPAGAGAPQMDRMGVDLLVDAQAAARRQLEIEKAFAKLKEDERERKKDAFWKPKVALWTKWGPAEDFKPDAKFKGETRRFWLNANFKLMQVDQLAETFTIKGHFKFYWRAADVDWRKLEFRSFLNGEQGELVDPWDHPGLEENLGTNTDNGAPVNHGFIFADNGADVLPISPLQMFHRTKQVNTKTWVSISKHGVIQMQIDAEITAQTELFVMHYPFDRHAMPLELTTRTTRTDRSRWLLFTQSPPQLDSWWERAYNEQEFPKWNEVHAAVADQERSINSGYGEFEQLPSQWSSYRIEMKTTRQRRWLFWWYNLVPYPALTTHWHSNHWLPYPWFLEVDVPSRTAVKKIKGNAHIIIRLQRTPGYFFWNVVAPTYLIVMVAMSTFLIDPTVDRDDPLNQEGYETFVIQLYDYSAITVTTILGMIQMRYVAQNLIPRKSYQTFADGYLLFGLLVNCLCFLDNLLVYMDVHEVSLFGEATGLPFRYNCVTENDGLDVAWGNGTRTDVNHGFASFGGGGGGGDCIRTWVTWTMFAFWNLLHLYLLFDVKIFDQHFKHSDDIANLELKSKKYAEGRDPNLLEIPWYRQRTGLVKRTKWRVAVSRALDRNAASSVGTSFHNPAHPLEGDNTYVESANLRRRSEGGVIMGTGKKINKIKKSGSCNMSFNPNEQAKTDSLLPGSSGSAFEKPTSLPTQPPDGSKHVIKNTSYEKYV